MKPPQKTPPCPCRTKKWSRRRKCPCARTEPAGSAVVTVLGFQVQGGGGRRFSVCPQLGLPELKRRLSEGYSLNDAAILALLSMISAVDDTNIIHRGGCRAAQDSKKEARRLLSNLTKENYKKSLEALDADYIKKNLSPGGCADLLAVSLMLCFLEQSGMTAPFDRVVTRQSLLIEPADQSGQKGKPRRTAP